MWTEYINATSIDEVIQVLAERGSQARIVAGATDLILEIERGQRKGITTLVDVTRIPDLDQIVLDESGTIHAGPLVTHNQCVASKIMVENAYPLARACWEVGSPQIRNRGTVAGNLITASPANDTITPLVALNAQVKLRSVRGSRNIALKDFYTGVRRTVMEPDEMLVEIAFKALDIDQQGTFIKFALRRAQAIALINTAVILRVKEDVVVEAAITLGAVAPTIVHATAAEEYLIGKELNGETIQEASQQALLAARPISDVRSSANYRQAMVRRTVARALEAISTCSERQGFPEQPVLLRGNETSRRSLLKDTTVHTGDDSIITRVNGKEYTIHGGQYKSLLHFIREEIGLTGSKEGCAEGECGACTVFLDGMAVMSCMVPAPRAHQAEIVTIEGVAQPGAEENKGLHPVQEAFIAEGAVQCGYCTPGFIMSAVKLLEERPHPDGDAIRQAITGNLCRCTGYYKIISAIERAARTAG